MKVGALTIGQSPRTDITSEIRDILGSDVTILESGVLDGLDEVCGAIDRQSTEPN
jgi:protein AroM